MRSRSRLGPLVLSVVALACGSPRDPAPRGSPPPVATAWPELPRTREAADALIRTRTARPLTGGEDPGTSSEALLHALDERPGALVAGDPSVVAWIDGFLDRAAAAGRDSVVLYGTYHDSGGQIDAFRRLIGPLGLRGLTHVAVEQLRAKGPRKVALLWGQAHVRREGLRRFLPPDTAALSVHAFG